MTQALIQRRGTGRAVHAGGMTVEYLATSDRTDDAIGIYRIVLAPASPGAGPHYHDRMTETFEVHAGTLAMIVDGVAVDAGPGDFVLIPPGVVHAFANRGDVPAVFTLSFTPALGREGFFEGMARLSDADRLDDTDAMLALMAGYDQVPVDGIAGWTQAD